MTCKFSNMQWQTSTTLILLQNLTNICFHSVSVQQSGISMTYGNNITVWWKEMSCEQFTSLSALSGTVSSPEYSSSYLSSFVW